MKIFKLKQLCKKTVLFAACLFMTVSVFSQEAEAVAQQPAQETAEEKKEPVVVLTVDEAVAYSAEHSFSLKTAQIDLELAKWKKNTAWNTFLPTVQLTGALARANDVSSSIKSANSTIEANKALYGALGSFNPAFATAAANMNPVSETESMHWTAMGNLSISFSFNVAMIQNMRATMASYESGVITWQTAVKENELNIKKL
nr:hypothetical protein [Treponema sp.]